MRPVAERMTTDDAPTMKTEVRTTATEKEGVVVEAVAVAAPFSV